MAIRAMFMVIALFVHGYVRNSTPRLYLLVLLMIFPVLIGLTAIQTLQETLKVQRDANAFFVHYGTHNGRHHNKPSTQNSANKFSGEERRIKLEDLAASKATLRQKVAGCKAVFTACRFELAFSVLAPWELKPIVVKGVKKLVSNTVSLVGACESKYALLGGEEEDEKKEKEGAGQPKKTKEEVVEKVRPKKEIEFGDEQLLRYLLKRVEKPLNRLQTQIDRSIDIVSACIAYAYDVPALSSEIGAAPRPKGILLQELDIHIDWLESSIAEFGKSAAEALEGAAVLHELSENDVPGEVDIMPREEIFLISSFMLNLRQAASHTLEMLKHSRTLAEMRQERKERRRIHFPKIKIRKWLFSGAAEPDTKPYSNKEGFRREGGEGERVDPRASMDTLILSERDKMRKLRREQNSWFMRARETIADFFDWCKESEAVLYAAKLTLGVMLCSWPAFHPEWAHWYYESRGVWVGLIYILVFENAVGPTIWIFALRAVGTIIGSTWGFAAYQAGHGNGIVIAVMIMLGAIPSYYVQLGTKYMKAGMVCTISMSVVAVSTHLRTVPGSSKENFYKRTVTMLIGGTVATLVHLIIFPVKARVGLKESLASAIVQINKMESCVAFGVDETKNNITSPRMMKRFEHASKKAEAALASAEAYLGFTKQEPRLKGSFGSQAVIYKEIIFVLRQIVDRMDNMLQLRKAYGSAVLEQYNNQIYAYRRNVAASITVTLFACHEALATKLPLPQFLPSARIAHLRMVVRVRQLLMEEDERENTSEGLNPSLWARRRALRLKFLSWNASSAALEECIEYVEELVDLVKMLVGANEFRSGLLNRPTYREYVKKINQQRALGEGKSVNGTGTLDDDRRTVSTRGSLATVTGRMRGNSQAQTNEEIPTPLQRIQSRRAAAKLERVRSKNIDGVTEE
ncbi:hypothetical protein RUND412_000462 [Rhizina undulata]